MAFSCYICDREFTENRSLTRHMKNQHGNLWSCHRYSQSFNRHDNYEMHQRACPFKATGKRRGEHLSMVVAKKLEDNVNRVGGALDGTVNEYRLKLEDEQQNAPNVLDVLKESIFQMENRINEDVAKKRSVKFATCQFYSKY